MEDVTGAFADVAVDPNDQAYPQDDEVYDRPGSNNPDRILPTATWPIHLSLLPPHVIGIITQANFECHCA
jgi:hypothetical protein